MMQNIVIVAGLLVAIGDTGHNNRRMGPSRDYISICCEGSFIWETESGQLPVWTTQQSSHPVIRVPGDNSTST